MDQKTVFPTETPWVEVINLLSELVVFNNYDFREFLKKFVTIVSDIVPVDSCLIYFHDSDKKQLILIGSKRSHPGEIGNISLKEGEGITGWVAQHKKTVVIEKEAYKDPRFKTFKELPEDQYESFLSIPIIDENGTAGVINLQNRTPISFSKMQIKTLESLVKIISSAFVKTILERKINILENKLEERKVIEKAKGLVMKIKNISENEAFQFIRKEAMKKRKSMKEMSEAILLVL